LPDLPLLALTRPRLDKFMKKLRLPVLFLFAVTMICGAEEHYHFIKEIPVGGDTGWEETKLAFASCGDGTTIAREEGAKLTVIQILKTERTDNIIRIFLASISDYRRSCL
jgi:hypothetical protein